MINPAGVLLGVISFAQKQHLSAHHHHDVSGNLQLTHQAKISLLTAALLKRKTAF